MKNRFGGNNKKYVQQVVVWVTQCEYAYSRYLFVVIFHQYNMKNYNLFIL